MNDQEPLVALSNVGTPVEHKTTSRMSSVDTPEDELDARLGNLSSKVRAARSADFDGSGTSWQVPVILTYFEQR